MLIYFDNAATTKPNQKAVEKASVFLNENFFNPSASYREGLSISKEISLARENLLNVLNAKNNYNLIFTSCGTEADNQAIFGFAKRGNFVTTAGEHSAIHATLNFLKSKGIEVREAKLNKNGSVNIDDLLSLIDEKTSLVSVIHINNETGSINDIKSICKKVKQKNKNVIFHSDGVQAFGKIDFKLDNNIDAYSVSAHKIGGLKGTGCLYFKKNLHIPPYIIGGGQENGLRSGTENVFGIKVFEYATLDRYEKLNTIIDTSKRYNELIKAGLDKNYFTILSEGDCTPFIISVAVEGVRGEVLMHLLNDRGVLVSNGSACSSKNRYSRVIEACGIDKKLADGVLRISIGVDNTQEEIEEGIKILNSTAKELYERMK